jgi:hypothetical protein
MLLGLACLLATPAAAAEVIGHEFCTVLQQQFAVCVKESSLNNDAVQPCPDATHQTTVAYNNAMNQAVALNLRSEVQTANSIWLDLIKKVRPTVGETGDAYTKRVNDQLALIISECERLRAAD